jgi:hypothetical protein
MLSPTRPTFAIESGRYLYAIDDRDGSLLALAFDVDGSTGQVSSSLVEAPQRFATGARDRINLGGSALALDIIDTRKLAGDYVCNPADEKGLESLIEKAEQKQASNNELQTLKAARDVATKASSLALRGVFVAVTDSAGALSIVDVHDADMFCRAGAWCTGNGAGENSRSRSSVPDPLAVQRHTMRRAGISEIEVNASIDDALAELDCPDGTFAALQDSGDDESTLVCASADPWSSFSTTFRVEYEGLYGGTTATFLEEDEDGRLVLRGAPGVDFCARGVVSDALDGEGDGYEGDWVVASAIPNAKLTGCAPPTQNDEPRLRVVQAFADHLILEDPVTRAGSSTEEPKPYDRDKLLKCFPTSMPVTWRVNGRYLVSWVNGYLHRQVASENDGACVEDESKDERLRSRTQPGELFQNPYIAFRLSELEEDAFPSSLDTTIQVFGGSGGLAVPTVTSSLGDSQPVVVRYLDITGDLFIVDTASQGLRRFGLSPLRSVGNNYR